MKQAKHEKHTLIFFFQSQESCFRRNPAQSHFRSTPTRFLGTSVPRYPFGSFEIGRAGFEISWRSLVHAQQPGSKRSCTRPGTGRIWENLGNLHGENLGNLRVQPATGAHVADGYWCPAPAQGDSNAGCAILPPAVPSYQYRPLQWMDAPYNVRKRGQGLKWQSWSTSTPQTRVVSFRTRITT